MKSNSFPNNNDMTDGECFWGYVVQVKSVGGELKERSQWMLLKHLKRMPESFIVADAPELMRVSKEQCKAWQYKNGPIVRPGI